MHNVPKEFSPECLEALAEAHKNDTVHNGDPIYGMSTEEVERLKREEAWGVLCDLDLIRSFHPGF